MAFLVALPALAQLAGSLIGHHAKHPAGTDATAAPQTLRTAMGIENEGSAAIFAHAVEAQHAVDKRASTFNDAIDGEAERLREADQIRSIVASIAQADSNVNSRVIQDVTRG